MRWLRVLVATLLGVATLAMTPTAAGAQGDGLVSTSTWTYRVDPDDGVVDVNVEAVYSNVKPNRSTSRGTTQYYFTGSVVVVPTDAEDISVTSSSGSELDWEIIEEESDEFFRVIEFGFARNIFYQQSTTVNVDFRLVDNGPRRTSPVRVNDAYAGFEVYAIDLSGTANVRVELPARFRVDDQFGSQMTETVADGVRVLEAEDVDTYDFWSYLSASDLDRAVSEDLTVEGIDITLRSWPDDAEWAEFATEGVEAGLPVLTELLGPWPLDPELDLVESYTPVHLGYAGWFDVDGLTIEISDELDDHLLFHELSHAWFNDDLFDERWITEGLAEVFAAEVVARVDDPEDPERADAPRVSLTDPEAIPLNVWSDFEPLETEAFAYPAAYNAMEEIAEQTGIDGLIAVIEAARNDELAYVGDGDPERISTENDNWQRLLDLAEEVGGAEDLTDVFENWIVVNRNRLEVRAETRSAYDELVAAGDGWAAPISLRTTMAAWDFDDAETQIADALELLDQRDELRGEAEALDLSLPDRLEADYEAIGAEAAIGLADPDEVPSDDDSAFAEVMGDIDDARADDAAPTADERVELIGEDVDALAAAMTDLSDAIGELDEARSAIDGASGFLVDVGLYGTDLEADYDRAVDAFAADDLEAATATADDIDRTVAEAGDVGQQRVLLAVAAVIGLLVLVFLFVWWRRRRRDDSADTVVVGPAAEAGTPEVEPTVAPATVAAEPEPAPDRIDDVPAPATLFDALGDEHTEIEPPDQLEIATATPGPEQTDVGEPPTT